MAIKAIVYTSNTGYTAEYAKLLHDSTDLPVYALEDAKRKLKEGTEIIYFGWLMAGSVMGYKDAAKLYKVKAVCGVGLATGGALNETVRKTNAVPAETAVFAIQGGFDMKKLKGGYKIGMMVMSKILKKKLSADTDENRRIIDMLDNGGSCVSTENLKDIISFIKAEK